MNPVFFPMNQFSIIDGGFLFTFWFKGTVIIRWKISIDYYFSTQIVARVSQSRHFAIDLNNSNV